MRLWFAMVLAHASAQCGPGSYGTSTCTLCAAGTFAYFRGSLACQTCPPYTGSLAGASVCVACNCGAACPACNNTCTACLPGTYNDGSAPKCTGCPPGTFSTVTQAVSVSSCSACDAGESTRPTDTGLTACTACAVLNQTLPLNSQYIPSADPLLCTWACNMGYLSVNATGAYTPYRGYTPAQSAGLFHIGADYCCSPTLAGVGTYLSGCNRSFDGLTLPCPPIANGYYFFSNTPKINRCADWACDPDYYALGSACYPQPRCAANATYQRDANGGLISLANGSFVCQPCSRCMDGAEPMAPCNSTVDTLCRLCSPTGFSSGGGICVASVPYGFMGVRVRLTSLPAFQGRPAVNFDGTPIDWTGLVVNTLTPCRPIPSYMVYTNNDPLCKRLDTQGVCPACSAMCRPWNGSVGWFMRSDECVMCVYDPTCAADQYSDMTACMGANPPACKPCPTALLPNSVRWVNPGAVTDPPCDFVCRDGYTKSNGSCLYCPNLPENARATVGCDWVCSLGFYQSGATACVPCSGTPAQCGIGSYLGYAPGAQCAKCLPCTNAMPNSVYTSSGRFNGPNSCGVQCVPGTFVDPMYGLDVFANPVACVPCSAVACTTGQSFLIPCGLYQDAVCQNCSECAPGSRPSKQCTVGADVACVACDPPPDNASWTNGCDQWACDPGFYPNGTACAACMRPSDCARSDRYGYVLPGCGVCRACNASLLLPGQCFNGDGQCGATYWCTTTRTTTSVTTTAAPTAAPTTTSRAITTVYASLVLLSLPSLDNVSKYIVCQNCTLRILSVTRNNVTTYWRRLLDDATIMVEVAVLSPVKAAIVSPTALILTDSYPVNATVLGDATALSAYLRSTLRPAPRPVRINSFALGTAAAVIAVLALLVCKACCSTRRHQRRPSYFTGVRLRQ